MVIPPKIGILGAELKNANLGVRALAAGTIECLLHRFPSAKVFFLNYGRLPACSIFLYQGEEVNIPLVNIRFSKILYLPNNIAVLFLFVFLVKLIPWQTLRRKLVGWNYCLREIYETNVFVSVAGGDSFSDIYGFGRLLYVALPQILVLLAGKRLIITPQTFGPFRTGIARAIARFIFARAELIYSRDLVGLEEIRRLLGHKQSPEKAGFCYDVGFVVVPRAPMNLHIEGLDVQKVNEVPLVGLNVSGLLFRAGYGKRNMFGLVVDYERLIHELCEVLIVKQQARVLLVPHVSAGIENVRGWKYCESDLMASLEIYEALKERYRDKIGIVRGEYDQSEIKHVIGRCEFFIGSRMHACIAALSQSIPAISIAYSDKFIGVMQALGVPSLVADARTMTEKEILASIDRAYEQRLLLRLQLESKIPEIQKTVLNLFEFINVQPNECIPHVSSAGTCGV
jgi:colanic acid/amylovoran biosynthesis protein